MAEQYTQVVEYILTGLQRFKGYYLEDYYLEFEERISEMKRRVEEILENGRRLKIGIVGEVKTGKSSFLNALIFNGKDVLPKATTPMTAALTKIIYAEKPSAKIVFYSKADWEIIKKNAEEYQKQFEDLYQEYSKNYEVQSKTKTKKRVFSSSIISRHSQPKSQEEMKRVLEKKIALRLVSCHELIEIAERSKVDDITEFFGQERELNAEDLQNGLENYIGANGDYTAIVKYVELRVNSMPKDIELVDTPGLNDPIISRSETTKKFLRECDVAFLLSYCGQFLSQEDITFMCDTLPHEGIRNVVLVGSKFDSGLLDENKTENLRTACNKIKAIYDKQAQQNLNQCLSSAYHLEVLQRLKQSLPPSYISSILYSCAIKQEEKESYSETEENIIRRLKEQFTDFQADSKTMFSLSGIRQVKRDKLRPIMEDKQIIIQERNREVISDNKKILLKILEDIHICAISNKESVERGDKGKLENKLEMLQLKLDSIRKEIWNIFALSAVESESFLNKIAINIEEEIDNYIYFQTEEKVHTEKHSYRTGFLWLKKEYYPVTITSYTANPSKVIQNLRQYITACKRYCNEEFEKVINLNILEKKVKETVIGAFDLSGTDFRETEILGPLEVAVGKIRIPKISIEVDQFEPLITEKFSEEVVEGNQIYKLELLENRVLHMISKEIRKELEQCQKRIEEVMAEQAATFVDAIIGNIKKNVENLRRQIEDKDNSIQQYRTLCDVLIKYKRMVTEMEI